MIFLLFTLSAAIVAATAPAQAAGPPHRSPPRQLLLPDHARARTPRPNVLPDLINLVSPTPATTAPAHPHLSLPRQLLRHPNINYEQRDARMLQNFETRDLIILDSPTPAHVQVDAPAPAMAAADTTVPTYIGLPQGPNIPGNLMPEGLPNLAMRDGPVATVSQPETFVPLGATVQLPSTSGIQPARRD